MTVSRDPEVDEINVQKLLALPLGTPRKRGGKIICTLYKCEQIFHVHIFRYEMYKHTH